MATSRRVILKVLLLLVLVPAAAAAQSIRGTVLNSAGSPVSGVVVLMLDDRDSVSARALTNESGEYRVSASAAGGYRLRTMRIGFRAWTSERLALTLGQDAVKALTLSEVLVSLDTVRVADRGACQTPKDSAAATFALWEQARTALTATQLTAGSRGIEATLLTYQRTLEPNRERVVSHTSSLVSGLTRGLWASPTADSLRRGGYIVTSPLDGSTTYLAPDLRVLLSNHFVEDHCFRLVDSRDPTRIGIEFEPNRDRRNVPGIRGTLWLDRKSAQLRRMEFRYANATREQQFGNAGGNMEFAPAKNGAWVISSWNIRMPVLVQRQARMSAMGGSSATTAELRVESIKLEGGEVALVMRGRDTLWSRTPMALVGTIADSATGAAVAGAEVALRGTGLRATTDAGGRFRIPDALPGDYTVEVRTRSLASFGYVHTVPVTFLDTGTVHAIRLPSREQVLATTCSATPGERGMVVGMVRLAGDTTPQPNVKVVASWTDETASTKRWGGIDARTDARGTFRICGVPLDATLTVSADAAAPVEVRLAGTRYAVADLVLDPTSARGATLAGVVLTDVNGQPMADVEVSIPELSKSSFTNERGAFRIENIPPGTRTVTARRVGYALLTKQFELIANRTVEHTLVLGKVSTLDTVVSVATVNREFEDNRKLGLGKFLTREDLDKLGGGPISSTLEQFQGLGVVRGRGSNAAYPMNYRASQGISISPNARNPNVWCPPPGSEQYGYKCGCYAAVYFDGVLMNPPESQSIGGRMIRPTPPFDVNSIPSASMEAVEWFTGMAQLPARYQSMNTECGVLVIHRRKNK